MTDTDGSVTVPNATKTLAAFSSDMGFDDIPDSTVTNACLSILDTVAAGYAGSSREEGERFVQFAQGYDGLGSARVWGSTTRTLPEFAALANGALAHTLEVDDGHRAGSAHPGSAVVTGVLAMALEEAVSGRDVVAAITVGYEVMCTLATAVQPSHRHRGFHTTATTGCFGAAAAVSSLLNLDADQTAHALGLAGTQAGGLFEFLEKGSMSKRFHPGRAAMAGIVAARAADAGIDGPDTIVEGEAGFARAFTDEYDLSPVESLGDPFEMSRRYLKPYPCCRHLHGPIDAAKELLSQGLDADTIAGVRVESYENAAYHDSVEVENFLDAQMSLPYALAVTFDTGNARLNQFDPPRNDERIRDLARRVTVVATEEMEAGYPERRPARLVVETDDGEVRELEVSYPLGSPENPLSEAAFETKFDELTRDTLPADKQDRLLSGGLALPEFDDASVFIERL